MEEDEGRARVVDELRAMFHDLDTDKSQTLDLKEIQAAPKHARSQLHEACKMGSVEELFHALDFDGSGRVGIDEFCDGIIQTSEGKPMELFCIMRYCRQLLHQTEEVVEQMR